ncbi:hypothetical protein VTH06DRAFT_3113 [Thermothelomyces fergusii]
MLRSPVDRQVPLSPGFHGLHMSPSPVSYAEVASKGPKQSPEEAAAPQPPQVDHTTASSTASLVDVDTPSVHTVPSDYASQEVKTETQAARIEREETAREEEAEAQARARARAEADLAKKAARGGGGGSGGARRAEGWLAKHWDTVGAGGAAGALALANVVAVVGLSGWLGFRAWGLYDRGRLGWREASIGLGVLGAVGLVEGFLVKWVQLA